MIPAAPDGRARARLLFICGGSYVYGLEKVLLRMIEGLAPRHDIYCTVNGWNDGVFPAALRRIGVPFSEIKLGWYYLRKPQWTLDSLVHLPGALLAYRRVLADVAPALVFQATHRTLSQLALMTGARNVMVVQDYWQGSELAILRRCDRVVRAYIACSDDIRRHLIENGLPADKIVRIYNPVPFDPDMRPSQIDAPRDVPTVGIVGQIIERKGHRVVIEALALIRHRAPDLRFRLKIFGNSDTDFGRELRQLAEARGVSDRIEWCGYITDQDLIYPTLDFTLVPTLTPDPLPLAAIEPSAYGIPSITTTAGGLAEIVDDGVTGYQVAAHDADALAERMLRLLSDPHATAEMGRRAYAANRKRFDIDAIVEQLDALMERLTSPAQGVAG